MVSAALGLAALGPALAPAERPDPAGPTREIVIAVANVNIYNLQPGAAAEALAALDADVLVTLETPNGFRDPDGALARRYRGVVNRVRWIYTGNWLWTDLPILEGEKRDFAEDRPAQVWARLDLGGGATLDVLGLHFRRPLAEPQERQIAGLPDALPDGLRRPLVALGDFNAAPWSEAVARVADALDLDVVGGLRLTWRSAYAALLGPLGPILSLPIDHVMVSEGLGVRSVGTAAIPGSDHRAVVIRLAAPLGGGAARAPRG